jgi:hypothetical protein
MPNKADCILCISDNWRRVRLDWCSVLVGQRPRPSGRQTDTFTRMDQPVHKRMLQQQLGVPAERYHHRSAAQRGAAGQSCRTLYQSLPLGLLVRALQ